MSITSSCSGALTLLFQGMGGESGYGYTPPSLSLLKRSDLGRRAIPIENWHLNVHEDQVKLSLSYQINSISPILGNS
jgi:hypothetical protein